MPGREESNMNKEKVLRQKLKKGKLYKIGAALVAVVLIVAMVIGYLPNSNVALAAEYASDFSTTTKYTESLGDNASTEYAGRIWTDKSVFTEDVVFSGYSGASQKVEKGNDDFLVSFSALATSQSISGQAQAPIDVVFVIDMSGSMRDNSMSGQSRLRRTIAALNTSIETLLATSENARVGVVAFSGEATTLLELDHYTKLNNNAFISTDSSENNIYTRAVGTTKGVINKTTQTSRGTNIQRGIFDGMEMLASVASEDTTVTINGQKVKRVPSIVLLSDGAPTIGSSKNWWDRQAIAADNTDYNYDDERPLYGMLAIMTASYMKAEVNRAYGVEGTANAAKVYSIGMGINDISNTMGSTQEDENLAFVTIDPKTHINKNSNNIKAIRDAWATYQSNNFTGIPTLHNYRFTHPADKTKEVTDINYVDKYYDADNATAVTEVFEEIVANISVSAPQIPTEHDVEKPMSSGYITYTDPIGEYMEVKNMKSIIYGGVQYQFDEAGNEGEVSTVTKDGVTTTTYAYKQTAAGNEVYGEEELSHILITVTSTTDENGIKKQVLTIQIPASLIPIRVNTVQLNENGAVVSHTNNGTYPIRVLYTVGLQDAVISNGQVDMSKISAEYLEKNPIVDGKINFYSNLYTGTKEVGGHTVGDATAVFDAASTNPFYYMQEDMVIYTDSRCTRVATDIKNDGTKYYYKEVYYHGNEAIIKATERTGEQLLANTTVVKHSDGHWYRPAGTVRVNNMLQFKGHKSDASGNEANVTGTANDFYAATFDGETGHFKVYLGNNGVMSMEATGSLEITKAVTADEGLTAPDKEFTFTVKLYEALGSDRALSDSYTYIVTGADGKEVGNATIKHGETITLKANEKVTIVNLPPSAYYEVEEAGVEGFKAYVGSTQTTIATGTITAGSVATAEFTNHYSVTSTSVTGIFKGTKKLEGRNWAEGDEFTFMLSGANNAPMPVDYDANEGITVTEDTVDKAFNFGTIKYEKPGLYRYTIYEKEPENDEYLAGMTYSRALYSVTVYVVDNGDGTLSATTNVQKLYTDDANPLFTYDQNEQLVLNPGQEAQDEIVFTNTYNAKSVVRVPVATKRYTDHSGQNPLRADMFQFKMTPVGIVENEQVAPNTSDSNPMPVVDGVKQTSVTTTNEGENITFLPVTFTQEDIPEGKDTVTYRYQMEEVIPAGATDNGDGTFTLEGMTYDGNKYLVDVTVSIDATSNILSVNAVYPNNDRVVRFTNVYDPEDTEAVFKGKKVLTGREILESDTFTFELKDASGSVLQTEVVTGVKEVSEVAFEFDNAVKYDKPGTYTYTITEKTPADADKANGVTYDKTVWTVKVEVTDNKGVLEKAVYYNNVEDAQGNAGAVFNNKYTPTESAPISLTGTKVLTGRELKAGQFYFAVEALNGAPIDARANYVSAQANGTITFFENVVYDAAGTYTYRISEVVPTDSQGATIDNGVTYDRSVYEVTVTVSNDYVAGTLNAAVTKIEKVVDASGNTINPTEAEAVVFENTYDADHVEYEFRDLQKILSGVRNHGLEENEFEFVRTATPADGIEFYTVDGAKVGINGEDKVKNAADGTVAFGNIKFTKVGTYVVTVKEVIPADNEKDPTITYDSHEIQATFEVIDNLEGKLIVTITDIHGSQIFTNEYTTVGRLPGATNLNVTKILEVMTRNPNTWTDADAFTFILEAGDQATIQAIEDGEVELPAATSIVIDKDSKNSASDPNTEDARHWKEKAFEDIIFHTEGDYTFNIREVVGRELGMDYDATVRTITVKTEDNGDGTLRVTTGEGSQTNPTFVNTYSIDDVVLVGHGNLRVNKVFTGRMDNGWLAGDTFNFTLEAIGDTIAKTQEPDPVVTMASTSLEVTKDNKDVAHFGNITFRAADTYEFMIKETAGTLPGVTYDTNQWKVTVVVKVSDETDVNGNQFLEIESVTYTKLNAAGNEISKEENEANLTFKNTYSTTETTIGGEVLEVTKEISGRDWLTGDAFTFTLKAANTATKNALDNNVIKFADDLTAETMSVTINSDASKQFDEITFYAPGTYSFIINEEGEDTATMKYDKHTAIITVNVVDKGDGTLEATTPGATSTMVWTNTFVPEPITASLEGIKRIEGRNMTDNDEFYFHISALNDPAKTAMPDKADVTNAIPADNKATITFGPLTFKAAGTYEYAISERTVNAHGIISDPGYVKATVKVDYDQTTGKLSVADGYPAYEKVNSAGTGFEFINRYSTEGLLDGSTHLKVTKHFTGRANHAWLDGDVFTFTLAAGDEATVNATKGENPTVILPTVTSITIGNTDALKEKAFGSIKFTKPGDYQFVVTEVVPDGGYKDGITYDSDPERTIFVHVVDNGDGTLTAIVVREGNKQSEFLTFNNKYDTTETTLEGSENLVVEKHIVGRNWITEDTYSFTLAADTTHALTKAALEGQDPIIVMPAEENLHVTITDETEDYKAAFGDIIFKETGTYKFIITEDVPTTGKLPSVTYDSRTKHITVVVTDNNDGTMTATATVDNHDNLVFVNTYKAAPTTVELEGTKAMAGDRTTLSADDKYNFTISVAEGSAAETPLPAELTVENEADGTITFAPITFNKVGVYKYEIKEVIPAEENKVPGVDYTDKSVIATVTVTDDNHEGELKAEVSYGSDGFVFTNTYTAEPIDVLVEGTKTVTVLDGNTYTMTGGEFEFEVSPVTSPALAGDPIKTAYRVSNAEDGKITIIDETYTEPGEYIYSVREVDGDDVGITEDSTVYTITVDVDDNGKGELVVTKSITVNSASVETIVFDNKYKPNVTSVLLHGLKKLDSEHKDALEAGIFKFNVTAVSGTEMVNGVETPVATENIPMPAKTQETHDATGVFQFATIEYTKPGTYVYEITEDATNQVSGYSYDDASYQVTVKVTDDDGNLKAEVTGLLDSNNDPIVVFTNGYVPTEVTLQGETALKGTKTLAGRDLDADEFEFKLTAADSETPMPAKATVKNAKDGGFSFEPITFSKEGTYYYTITETDNGLGGVTYDETVYTVKVAVTDKGGYLAAEVTYSAPGDDSQVQETKDSVVFANAYSADSVLYALSAEKTISGRELNEKEFSFVLKENNIELQTKENTASGAIAFDAIEYNAAGKYVYTITEVMGDKGGVTYDTATFEVTVEVTDNLVGELTAEVIKVVEITDEGSAEVESKEVVFENAYAPADTSITLTGTKTLTGRDLVAGEFTFLLKNVEGNVVSRATNAADGTITFDELQFTQTGIFEYTVVEDDSAQVEGIVYDDVEYKVLVKVIDNLEGELVAEVIAQEEIIFKNQYTEPLISALKMQAVNNGEVTVKAQQTKSGDIITYTIKAENSGNATAKNIVITDKVPEGLELIVGTIKGGDAIKVTEDGTITWTIFRLEAGKSAEVSFQVTVPAVKEDTTWTNVATYVYDNNPNNPEDPEEPKTVEETNEVELIEEVPKLVIVKKQRVGIGFATDQKKAVKAGDKVVYYITVTNIGNGDANDVTITDKVPEGLRLVDGSISKDGILTDGVITWNFDTIKAGEEVTVEFAVKVPDVTADTTWKNVAVVVYGNNPDNPDDPTDPNYSETPTISNEVIIEAKVVVTPVTGDTATITMWFAAAMASMLTVIGTLVNRKRKYN